MNKMKSVIGCGLIILSAAVMNPMQTVLQERMLKHGMIHCKQKRRNNYEKDVYTDISRYMCIRSYACGNWLEGARLDADISEDEIKSWIEDAE